MDIETIKEAFEGYKKVDTLRQESLKQILDRIQDLEKELKKCKSDLDSEKHARRHFQDQVESMTSASLRNQFIHVIIDGDGYIFNEKYLLNPESGAIDAAHDLRSTIRGHLQTKLPRDILAEYDIMVTVLANKKGLSNAIGDSPKLGRRVDLEDFFCKFSQSNPLFQFVDCGAGKERADSKLRAIYRHHVYNIHCRHIFLACCHDNGYVADLTQYCKDSVAESKTTLIEHPQHGKDFYSLPFEIFGCGRLFMQEPLFGQPKRPWISPSTGDEKAAMAAFSYSQAAKDFGFVAPEHIQTSATATKPGVSRSSSWQTSNGVNGTSPTQKPSGLNGNTTTTPRPTDIPINQHGDRVDKKLTPIAPQDMKRFEERILKKKLCNEHHLRGICRNKYCQYDHNPIEPLILLALRHVARRHPCAIGRQCRLENCYSGHTCPFTNCIYNKCKFAQNNMHDVKQEIIKYVEPTDDGYPTRNYVVVG